MSRNLIVGSVTIPLHAAHDLQQTYQELRARSLMRLANGSALVREVWKGKLSTDIRGEGSIPPGLTLLDFSAALTLYCVAPRVLSQTSNVFLNVTTARRSDSGATPYGRALVGNDFVLTTVTWGTGADVNKATLGTVSGSSQYQLVYYPQLSVICDPPREDWDWNAVHGWSIHAEEV